ncbi:hypothetical protein I3J27_22990 [Bradyrhizobium xenonodulans]|uniref:DUF1330 domain-containing protein n=1 Tax=Bradyrhizobium xenonodulans TaxID=2736875 RepID=A0ABY7ME70_9BRAD|nr:hypothetical protein [Bradyrhizobium xenonodulans]WBL75894.1 hypothetical protein I3J27_22990 [Bradyrhizobium xenonodulans]
MFVEIGEAALASAAAKYPGDQPIFMLNLLRYRDEALYRANAELPVCSGREAYYTRYVPAFRKLALRQGVVPTWLGSVGALLVGAEGEAWHDVAIVRYPDFATFQHIVSSADYRREAEPHRLAALADWRLIATTEVQVPD